MSKRPPNAPSPEDARALDALESIAASLRYLCTKDPSLLAVATKTKPRRPARAAKRSKKDVSRRDLKEALRQSGGTAAGAARILNMTPKRIVSRMKKHNIEVRKPGRPALARPPIAADQLMAKIGEVLNASR